MIHCVYQVHIAGGGKLEYSKIEALEKFGRPKTKRYVSTFLGVAGYYPSSYHIIRQSLAHLQISSRNLNTITLTGQLTVKMSSCSAPVMQSPDFNRPFILQTNASERGVGAVLSQTDDEGADHPIIYFSCKLSLREECYSIVQKECFAIKLSVQAFPVYLLGRPFIIQTNYCSLEWLDRIKDNNAWLTHWSLFLQPYNYTVEHCPGRRSGSADALSRG